MKIIQYKKTFLWIGGMIMVVSAIILFWFGLKPGIDFTGGSLMEVSYENRPMKADVETKLNELDLGGYSLRESLDGKGQDSFQLRTRNLGEDERVAVETILLGEDQGAAVSRFTSVGPVVGDELTEKSKWAIGAVVLIIVLYVGIAFMGVRWPVGSSVYGGITIISLLHDVLVPAALMALLGHFFGAEIDVLFVIALLAILGYSVNDTIVVFDRVRENIVLYRGEHKKKVKGPGGLEHEETTYSFKRPFSEIVGLSVNETMLRSINTSLTTGLALVALYFFGGEVTKNFALILLVGVAAGAYSSIFFASPLLVWYAEWKENKAGKSI